MNEQHPMPHDVQRTHNDGILSVQLEQRLGSFHLSVDFRVPLGLIVLFGYSGAGKSLTLQSLAGLQRPKHGSIAIDGQVLFDSQAKIDLAPQVRRVGYVPQRYALFPHLTVEENIRFALPASPFWSRVTGKNAAHKARIGDLLTALELQDLARRYPGNLSGGQQQRVSLARALAAEPRLLLLDEPFNALDASVRERLRDALKSFQRRFAVPIVLVTHDHTEVQQLADTVIVMQRGRVEQIGSVEQVFFAPRTADVAQLVGQRNIFGGYIASPPTSTGNQPERPAQALRLNWLQITSAQTQVVGPHCDKAAGCWLPLPLAVHPTQPSSLMLTPETSVSGCILASEMRLHRLPGGDHPPIWTPWGAAQWMVELREAHIQGASMRLLVCPLWNEKPAHPTMPEGLLEVYLSFSQWRSIEAAPGDVLLLEIGPQAIHLFASLAARKGVV